MQLPLALLGCAPAWTQEAGAFEDSIGQPYELLAGCQAALTLDGLDLARYEYDDDGFIHEAELFYEDAWQAWYTGTVDFDDLGRPTLEERSNEGETWTLTTTWEPDSWRRSSTVERTEYARSDGEVSIDQVTRVFTWTEGGVEVEGEELYNSGAVGEDYIEPYTEQIELAEGTRPARVDREWEEIGATRAWTYTWHQGRRTLDLYEEQPYWVERSFDEDGRMSWNLDQDGLRNDWTWSCP